MTYHQARLKRLLEQAVMMPFILLGRLYGNLFPLKIQTRIFLFFPSADIGGAIKVNADIAHCLKQENPLIVFSKRPKNNGHADLFRPFRVMDLHRKIDYKLIHFVNIFYRGVLSAWINKAENPVIFGGECLYFYKIIPHVKKTARVVELCHLPTWFPYSIGFIDLISCRVFSTLKLKQNAEQLYRDNHLPQPYFDRLYFVENEIDIPDYLEIRNERLEVVFIGRGAPQKRVHLVAAIAKRMFESKVAVHFSFVGDVDNIIQISDYPFCSFYGNVRDEERMQQIYRQSDVLILTSASEGLPVVVMQMMAHGKVVLSTAVNAIPDYITHLDNGLLITATIEEEIINEAVALLQMLVDDPLLKTRLGQRSRQLALEKFNGDLFCREYRTLMGLPEKSCR
jgi:glycosyltransferase involved in cell wall biosynthesis